MLRPYNGRVSEQTISSCVCIGNLKRYKRMSVSGSPPNPDSLMCQCLAQSMPRHALTRRAFLQSIVHPLYSTSSLAPLPCNISKSKRVCRTAACKLTLSIKGTQTGYRRSECLVRKFCTSEGPRWPWKSVQSLSECRCKKACPASRLSLKRQCFGRVSRRP